MIVPPFHLVLPQTRSTSVMFASPHSGRDYPADFLATAELDEHQIRSSEDAFVDDLFQAASRNGAPLLAACAPRAYVDLNRGADELDPALIEGIRRPGHNPRVASGLGVIPRVVANGRAIYRGKIALAEAHRRLNAHWRPYHDQLQSLVDENIALFGESILIDCHSMPHEALESLGTTRPDVVLGDRFSAAASPAVVDRIESAFASAGLSVVRNMPFAGAYITQTYGRPSRKQHAVQIEIDRSLYMNEATIELRPDYPAFRSLIDGIVAEIAEIGRRADLRVAAE